MSHQGPIITTSDGALQWLRWAGGLASREAGFCLAVADADEIAVGNVMVTDIDRHCLSPCWAHQRARRGRGWQRGQVYDERFMNASRRIGVPHRGQGSPSCP